MERFRPTRGNSRFQRRESPGSRASYTTAPNVSRARFPVVSPDARTTPHIRPPTTVRPIPTVRPTPTVSAMPTVPPTPSFLSTPRSLPLVRTRKPYAEVTRGTRSAPISRSKHEFPSTPPEVLPRGSLPIFSSVRHRTENSENNLDPFRPPFPSHTPVAPPEPTPPPLEVDSISSESPSFHGDDLPNHVSFHSSSAPFRETDSPFSFTLGPIPNDVQDFGDWLQKHFSCILSLDDRPGFLHDFLYDRLAIENYNQLYLFRDYTDHEWVALLDPDFYDYTQDFLLEFWIIVVWVCT
jgi:hypothetical protein